MEASQGSGLDEGTPRGTSKQGGRSPLTTEGGQARARGNSVCTPADECEEHGVDDWESAQNGKEDRKNRSLEAV